MANSQLDRITFHTSRMLDFCSEKELTAQTGHGPNDWPLVVLKELMDNALDACEEARVAPEIKVSVGPEGICISDNGPGIPDSTIQAILDFTIRVSSREAYMAPRSGGSGQCAQNHHGYALRLEWARR